jgi:hypothetical protein
MKLPQLETRVIDNQSYLDFRREFLAIGTQGWGVKIESQLEQAVDEACEMLDRACDFWFSELPDIGLLDRDGGERKQSQYDQFLTELGERRRQLKQGLPRSIQAILDFEDTVLEEQEVEAGQLQTWGDRLNSRIVSAMNCLEGYIYWLTLVQQDFAPSAYPGEGAL